MVTFSIKELREDTHPEAYALRDKVEQCEKRGHGKWVTHRNGDIQCHACGLILGSLHRDQNLDYLDDEYPEEKADALF